VQWGVVSVLFRCIECITRSCVRLVILMFSFMDFPVQLFSLRLSVRSCCGAGLPRLSGWRIGSPPLPWFCGGGGTCCLLFFPLGRYGRAEGVRPESLCSTCCVIRPLLSFLSVRGLAGGWRKFPRWTRVGTLSDSVYPYMAVVLDSGLDVSSECDRKPNGDTFLF